jgi:hypothetical protein
MEPIRPNRSFRFGTRIVRSNDRVAVWPSPIGAASVTGRAVQSTASDPAVPPTTFDTWMGSELWQPSMPLSHSRIHTESRVTVAALVKVTDSVPRHLNPC